MSHDEPICPHCEMPVAIRNPSGFCDHLYYPEMCTVCLIRARPAETTVRALLRALEEFCRLARSIQPSDPDLAAALGRCEAQADAAIRKARGDS